MLKKHLAACAFATALISAPAFAQTATAPAAGSAGAMSGQFMAQQSHDQWRASKLVGLNVYGPTDQTSSSTASSANNANRGQKIGDINDVLLDHNGNAAAVVIGVGGFLGIGEKNVAVPFKSVEFVMTDNRAVASAAPGSVANPAAAPAPGTVANSAATTGTTATTTATNAATVDRGYPDHAMIRMTKADLQNAPTFHYAGDRSAK